MKWVKLSPIAAACLLAITATGEAQWTKELAAEQTRLEHMTNDQVMAELVHDEHSDFSDSTEAEIVRFAQLDALLFAKNHGKVSMQEAERIASLHARMHHLQDRDTKDPIDLTDLLAASDYSSTFFTSLGLIYEGKGEQVSGAPNVDDENAKKATQDDKEEVSDLSSHAGNAEALKNLGIADGHQYETDFPGSVDALKIGWHRAQVHHLRGKDAKAYANGFASVIDPQGAFYP
jgi:hypothetical protein